MSQYDSAHVTWMLLCICLLVFMQLGFSCLEAGAVRAKNSINVVIKNCLDFCVSILCFTFVGFALMFASAESIGSQILANFSLTDTKLIIFILFHAMFCATTVTIISGAVAERMSLSGYISITVITAVVIYPLCGRWVWGGALFDGVRNDWLTQLGFHDFAGGTLVHSVGGWIALASVIIVGPRIGRFGDDSQPIRPSSLPLASLGVFMLWIGWMGFNGGSQLMLTNQTTSILYITVLGGVAGMSSAALASKIVHMQPQVILILNGGLAGLVAITAGADILTPWQALLLGAICGLLPQFSEKTLEKYQIDDGVGVIPVHLFAGIVGTLAIGLLMPLTEGVSRLEQLGVQVFGVIVVGSTAFSIAYVSLKLISLRVIMRVPKAGELVGLNVWEHGASTAQIDLLRQMSVQAELGLFNHRIVVEPHTEEHHIATYYNTVLDKFNEVQEEREKALEKAVWLAEHDALTGVKNRRAVTQVLTQEYERISRGGNKASVAIIDIDFFKNINDKYGHDIGDKTLIHFTQLVSSMLRKTDMFGRIGGEEFVVLFTDTDIHPALEKLEKIRAELKSCPLHLERDSLSFTFSAGLTLMSRTRNIEASLKAADTALFEAKKQGRDKILTVD